MTVKDEKDDDVVFTEEGDELDVKIGKDEPEQKTPAAAGADDRLARAEAEQRNLSNHIINLQNQLSGQGQSRNEPDQFETELNSIADQERALGIEFEALRAAKGLTPEKVKDFDTKARSLAQRRSDISAERSLQRVLPRLQESNQNAHIRAQYRDVIDNPLASTYAKGRYDILRSLGAPDSMETVDRAMNDARIEFKLPGARKNMPTDQDRQQLSGVGGGGGRATNSNTVKMGKAEKQMAMAMYGERFNGDEKKIYAMWAKGPGLRAAKAAAKGRRVG